MKTEEINAAKSTGGHPASVAIGRQPVFDEKIRLWGYDLFCLNDAAQPDPRQDVAINLHSSAYACLEQFIVRGRKIIVGFTEKDILENLPYALPPTLATIRIPEHVAHDHAAVDVLESLKSDGFHILVHGFSGNPDCVPLYQIANVVSMDAGNQTRDTLPARVAAAGQYKASLMATRVRDHADFRLCWELGFNLFHGPFFKAPDQVKARKLTSNEVLRFKLLQLIERDEPDLERLAKNILVDATISLRLLAYLNSAAFGFTQTVSSVQQAVALLGWRNVRNWLRVVLLTDMGQSKAAQELVVLSAQRGMFLERVAGDHNFWSFDPAKLQLIGVFSLLDALLGMPMIEVVKNLPLDQTTKAALCRETDSEYLPLLLLAQSLEETRWADADRIIQELNLDEEKVKAAFQTSVEWASQLDADTAKT